MSFTRDTHRPDAAGTGRSRTALVLFILLGALLAAFFLPLRDWLHGQVLKPQLESFGLAAPLVFIGGGALLTAIGAPRLVLCSLAGMVFGVYWGLVWSQIGTLLGAYGIFLIVRNCGREPILRRYPRLDRYSERIRGRGLLAVLLIRQLPMNGFHNNLLLGLSPVRHRDFLLGSLLGYLPLGLTAVLIGAGVVQTDLTRVIQYAAAGIAAFPVLGFLLKYGAGLARNRESTEIRRLPVNPGIE